MPFAVSSNACCRYLSALACCLDLPEAATPPVGAEPNTGMAFVQPQDAVRHLGILLSACDQTEATRKMFARRLKAVRFRI